MPPEPEADAFRRTQLAEERTELAQERTYLAWCRTGIAALAVAIGVGAVLPNLATGAAWPYVVIGVAFSLLGIAFFAYGLRRVRVVRSAIQRGVPADPDDRVVIAVTSVGVALGFLTVAILLYQL